MGWDSAFFGCSIITADQDTPSARYGQSMVAYQQGARSKDVFGFMSRHLLSGFVERIFFNSMKFEIDIVLF